MTDASIPAHLRSNNTLTHSTEGVQTRISTIKPAAASIPPTADLTAPGSYKKYQLPVANT